MKTGMFKKFFGFVKKPLVIIASKFVSFAMCFMPKKSYVSFVRKYDSANQLADADDETILASRKVLRIQTAIKSVIMAIGTLLGHVLYKKFHAC